jgi:GGDEF domain-containing protein
MRRGGNPGGHMAARMRQSSERVSRDAVRLVNVLNEKERALLEHLLGGASMAELAGLAELTPRATAFELRQAVHKLASALDAAGPRPRPGPRSGLVTPVTDRRAAEHVLRTAIARAARTHTPLAILYLVWAETEGGDHGGASASPWRLLVHSLAKRVRPQDVLIRWSETAALFVLERTTEAEAEAVCQRLQRVDESEVFGMGVAERRPNEDMHRLVLRAADMADQRLVDIQTRRRIAAAARFS